ncbi:hypothetical protein FKW77_000611 [Venturia effusa]|uniref:Uncharacterized protein n=1 Tax=Venturia effusa TaxID=50376 RepID=A0A517LN77_9PEZI|nr:hypothetical protein FKW77_000611 [Venturia effusa]
MPPAYFASPSSAPKWKRFYSSTSLIDPRKKIDISTWIILTVALCILASAFIILYLVWRNQRNARKEALEGEVDSSGVMTFGEEYGVDLCKVNDKFRQYAEEKERGTSETEMVAMRRTSVRTVRRYSSPLSGKTSQGGDEIVVTHLLTCPPTTPATPAFARSTSNRHTMQLIMTCTPDRSDRESTVERELMEIERAGKPRGGWWSSVEEEPFELPRGGSRDLDLQMILSEEPRSSPSDMTRMSPKRLSTIIQSGHTTPEPSTSTKSESSNIFQPKSSLQIVLSIPASLPQDFQGLSSSPSPYVNAPLPTIPPRAAARGRSPAPAPITTFRTPLELCSSAVEEDFSASSSFIHAPTLAPGHHYSSSQHRKYSNTPLPAIPGHFLPRSDSPLPPLNVPSVELDSDYPESEDDEVELREVRDTKFARDPSPEPELGTGRQIQIRKSSGKLEEWSPTRLSQCPTAVSASAMFSPVGIQRCDTCPKPEQTRTRSPSPCSFDSMHPLRMNAPYTDRPYAPEPLRISTDTDTDELHLSPGVPIPTPPTPRTQQAHAVGAAMLHLLNGKIHQHKLMQMQRKPSEGHIDVDPVRAREVSEVQSLAWAEKRGWGVTARTN